MSVFLGSQPTELSINDCFAEPCENNATCSSLPVGYTCICQGGWTGIHILHLMFFLSNHISLFSLNHIAILNEVDDRHCSVVEACTVRLR